MFKHTSRYYNLKTVKYTTPEGLQVAYKRRRFLPQGGDLPLLLEVKVRQEDRLDLIAARILGDPEQFWRLADANNAMATYPEILDDPAVFEVVDLLVRRLGITTLDNWDPLRPYVPEQPTTPPTQITYRDMRELMKSGIPVRQTGMFRAVLWDFGGLGVAGIALRRRR